MNVVTENHKKISGNPVVTTNHKTFLATLSLVLIFSGSKKVTINFSRSKTFTKIFRIFLAFLQSILLRLR